MGNNVFADFTHLRVHSHFSFLRGTCSLDALVERASGDGFSSLALTDINGMSGAVQFSNKCLSAGIKPILGITFEVAVPVEGDSTEIHGNRHITLLAKDRAGYRSLCALSSSLLAVPSRSSAAGPGLSWEAMRQYREGLLCLEAGRSGWLQAYLREGRDAAVQGYLNQLKGLYGEHCYLSLEIHTPEDQIVSAKIISLGAQYGLPVVAVQPVYILDPEERSRLNLLAAIDHNCTLEAVTPAMLPVGGDPEVDFHWLTLEQVAARHAAYPEALATVSEIVQRCEPSLPDGSTIWPSIELPADKKADDVLMTKAEEGLVKRFGRKPSAPVRERLRYELNTIQDRGYATLFLIVADVVRFAHEAEIPVSTRGSVANSLVAFCVGITSVDPIENDLLFERFLNPARVDLPDIDLDFCSRRRDEVLTYLRRKYGVDRVALVATISTMQPKSAVGETAKAYGLNEVRIKRLTAQLPRHWHPDPRRRDRRNVEALLDEFNDPLEREIVRVGYQLVGQPHHLSIHPGGVVITPGPLTDIVPLQWAPKGFLITQFNHVDLESIGIPKLDLLGIRALTVLTDAAALVREHTSPDFTLDRIPVDDARTASLLANGETIGVFQCESAGARRTLRQLKARNIQDLAVANAFFKPGPATGGMAQSFIRRYRGEEPVSYLHPTLEPILSRTKGVLIFQEQILRVACEIARLSWEQADHLRRGMSKFLPEEMQAMRSRFLDGCMRAEPEGSGFTAQQADQLWEQVLAFAGYGFNQGHATAYAMVSYRSAYIKAHWPEAFLCARLAGRGGFHHPAIYIAEARRLGIRVRAPHVNRSRERFTLDYESGGRKDSKPILWMGLGWVKDLRRRSIVAIQEDRSIADFVDLRDLSARVRLQRKELEHLIQCGALDDLEANRRVALAQVQEIQRAGPHQIAFEFAERESAAADTVGQRIAWEREILGFPVSENPLRMVSQDMGDMVPLSRCHEASNKKISLRGYRLPGRTGASGFFFGDGETFIQARFDETSPQRMDLRSWEPVRLEGSWRVDEWGGGWFQIRSFTPLSVFETAEQGKTDL